MDWWKEEYTKMTEGTIQFIEHKQLILYGTKPLIVLSGFYNLL
jgi:alpha-glucuronidase